MILTIKLKCLFPIISVIAIDLEAVEVNYFALQ